MSIENTNTEVARASKEDREVSFQAFGTNESIRMSIAIIRSTLVKPTRSGKLPTDADCVKFMMMCKARKLNPYEGDAFLIGYDAQSGPEFSLITSHQAFLKRAEVNPNFDGMDSGVVVQTEAGAEDHNGDFMAEGETLLGAWARVYIKNRRPTFRKINFKTFAKNNQRWQNDPAGMIVKCAEADALRSSFPTLLGGLYVAQEMARIERGETIEVGATQSFTKPDFSLPAGPQAKAIAAPEKRVKLAVQKPAEAAETQAEANPDDTAPDPSNSATSAEIGSQSIPSNSPAGNSSAAGVAPEVKRNWAVDLQAILDREGITFDEFRVAAKDAEACDDSAADANDLDFRKAWLRLFVLNPRTIVAAIKAVRGETPSLPLA